MALEKPFNTKKSAFNDLIIHLKLFLNNLKNNHIPWHSSKLILKWSNK